MRNGLVIYLAVATAMLLPWPAMADWTDARCDIYPKGEDHASASIPCVFGQSQGYVTITRSDGITHDLKPVEDHPGNYRDQHGKAAYRNSGLGEDGLIFRMSNESVYVYWDTSGLPGETEEDNYTAPYSTRDWDATTRLPCSLGDVAETTCPAGINRGPGYGQAVIAILRSDGVERILQFDVDTIATPSAGEINAGMVDDEWIIRIDKDESYRIPRAAVEGG